MSFGLRACIGGMWSVVTPVPAGTHEFKFVVDGEWKHSTRHPTVGEDEETMNNIRVIRGPPKNKQNSARLSEQRNKDAGMTAPKQKKCCVVSLIFFLNPPLLVYMSNFLCLTFILSAFDDMCHLMGRVCVFVCFMLRFDALFISHNS